MTNCIELIRNVFSSDLSTDGNSAGPDAGKVKSDPRRRNTVLVSPSDQGHHQGDRFVFRTRANII